MKPPTSEWKLNTKPPPVFSIKCQPTAGDVVADPRVRFVGSPAASNVAAGC